MPDITIQASDGGSFSAYLAEPSSGTGAGMLIIQEIFGVNAVMRGITDAFAAQGYFAICPDIFWRQQPGIQITDQTDEEWTRAFELFKGFDQDTGLDDLKSTMAHLRGLPGCTGKAGTAGYCLGGRMVYLMAARSDADCNVSYYGVGLENNLNEAANITTPTMLHIAELDKFVPPKAQAQIRAGLASNPQINIHTYTGVDHAFARTNGQTYDKAAADLANQRTVDFLRSHLA
jgi:carboxymethylenebutenolidase